MSPMHRRQGGYRLFRPRYDWNMIRDQVGESAYGNAVRTNSNVVFSAWLLCNRHCIVLFYSDSGILFHSYFVSSAVFGNRSEEPTNTY